MILKIERHILEIPKPAPEFLEAPFDSADKKRAAKLIRQAVAGYRPGKRNPYVEHLMKL